MQVKYNIVQKVLSRTFFDEFVKVAPKAYELGRVLVANLDVGEEGWRHSPSDLGRVLARHILASGSMRGWLVRCQPSHRTQW